MVMLTALHYYWTAAKGHRLTPWRSAYLRWRMETFFGPQAAPPGPACFLGLLWRERRRLAEFLRWTEEYRNA
jgi:hypothetical protein